MKNCNVSHSKESGLYVWNGGLMTIDGNGTTIHHNCTNGDSWAYGLYTYDSFSSIHLVSPLTKETISTNNGGGGNYGGWGTIKTIPPIIKTTEEHQETEENAPETKETKTPTFETPPPPALSVAKHTLLQLPSDKNTNEKHKVEAPPFHQIIYFNDETKRKTYRTGQGTMRLALIEEFKRTCPASLCSEIDMLDAAHIVPYSECNHCEPSNGLLLHTAVHRAMDRGKIIYDDNGQLWRHHTITDQWLHGNASIRCNQLNSDLLTDQRKQSLDKAYNEWMKYYEYKQDDEHKDLCKVKVFNCDMSR